MLHKLGKAILLFFILSTANADESITYLIHTRSDTGDLIQGAAITDSDHWEVGGYVILGHELRASFVGRWNRMGKIEAVDSNGDMYMFDVIRVLNDTRAIN